MIQMPTQMTLYKIEGSKTRQIFKTADIEWCQYLKGFTKPNPITKIFIDLVKSKFPDLFLGCPMKGRIDVLNLELKGSTLTILPKGIFKIVIKSFGEGRKPLLVIAVVFQVED